MYNPQLQTTPIQALHPVHLSIMYPKQTPSKRIKINQLYTSSCQIVSQSEHQLYIDVISILAKTSASYSSYGDGDGDGDGDRECFEGSEKMMDCGEYVGGDVGLVGWSAGEKFRQVRQAIVEHTDAVNCTKEVHKVLYLIFQYLETIAITSPYATSNSTSHKNNNSPAPSSYKQNYFRQWLISASNLFNKQLQFPPIDGLLQPQKTPQGPSKRNRKYFSTSRHNPKSSPHEIETTRQTILDKQKQIQNSTYCVLKKTNNYYYLLQMLEEYQLEQLVQKMEILASNVNLLFDDVGIDDQLARKEIGRMRNNAIGRIQGILEMLVRKMHLHQKFGTKELLLVDPDLGFVKSANIVHVFQQQCVSKGIDTSCEDQIKSLPYEQYQNLSRVLKCMTGILLGNQTTIANYARDNIYLYLALMLMYSQTQPFYTSPQNTQQVLQHLQKIHHVKISRPSSSSPINLNQTHSYLLQLISLPLPPCLSTQSLMTSSTDDRPLALHYFFQDTIAYFRGYEFYAYLIISVMFNMGFANSQLCRLDQQYQSNIESQLLLASIGEPVARKQTIIVKSKLLSDALEGERQLNRFDSLSFKSSQQLNPIRQKSHEQSQWQSAIMPLESANRQKLFLATISFYRNILHRSRVSKQLRLQYRFDQKQFGSKQAMMREQLDYKLSNQMLPLHELIINLWKCCFSFRPFQSQAQIIQLREVSKYAIEAQVTQQFSNYLRQLLNAIMQVRPDDWLIDQQTLELMQIQLQVNLLSNPGIQQNIYKNTLTFQLFDSGYLTSCTLVKPFNYALLSTVENIAGINSNLYQQSESTAHQFFKFFRIFFELQNLTKRGSWNDTHMPMNIQIQQNSSYNAHHNAQHQKQIFKFDVENNEVNNEPENNKINQIKLKNTLYRLQKLQEVFSHYNYSRKQGCGEVARVAWQVLQDYQALKADLNKEIELKVQQNRLLSEAGEKVGEIIGKVRQFIQTMRHEGYTSYEMNKFRKLLY